MEEKRRISNSEVGSWLSCKAKYRFAFDMKLEKIDKGDALTRGILGHELLEKYYSLIKAGMGHDHAVRNTKDYLSAKHPDKLTDPITLDLLRVLDGYWAFWQGNPNWKILRVEESFDLHISEQFTMPIRLDLLVKEVETGLIYLVDHKFCYDFWTEDDIALNPQFAKYVGALRANRIQVDGCILNQIRYRKLKDPSPVNLYKHTIVKPSGAKIRNTIKDHITASLEITDYRNKEVADREVLATKVLNKMVCRGCEYKNLCSAELDGGEIDFLIENEYRPNSYDYNKEESNQEGLL